MQRPTRPDLNVPDEGWEVAESPDWTTHTGVAPRSRCRHPIPGQRTACRRRPVAVLFCGAHARPYAYCEQHLFGGWIENGKVVHWRVKASWR